MQEEEGQRVVALLLLLPTFFVADLLAKVDQDQAQDQHQLTLCRLQLRPTPRKGTVAARQPRANYTQQIALFPCENRIPEPKSLGLEP